MFTLPARPFRRWIPLLQAFALLLALCQPLFAGVTEDTFHGIPRADGYPHRIRVLDNEGFAVGYCRVQRVPVWVAYRLGPNPGEHDYDRPSGFDEDERLARPVDHDDYTNSGYDRGHLAPNYAIMTRYGRRAQLQTFRMSNVAPMRPALNRHSPWRDLEKLVARGYANRFGEVWVITGCIFDRWEEELSSGVEIPDAFYKIVADQHDGQLRVQAFVFGEAMGSEAELKSTLTSVDRVERLSGLNFFHKIKESVEDRLESRVSRRLWMDPSDLPRRQMEEPDAGLSGKINVNTASQGELEKLHGIGPVKARRITDGRPYEHVDELRWVKGIGPKTMKQIRPNVTVGE